MNSDTGLSQPYWLLEKKDEKKSFVLVISGKDGASCYLDEIRTYLSQYGLLIDSDRTISSNVSEFYFKSTAENVWRLFQTLLTNAGDKSFDIAVLPIESRQKKLLVCDMDSTIVTCETLDDVAAKIGIGEKVKKITDRAMRGELDFKQALDERVSLLAGLSETVFLDIANEVQFNSGAEQLIKRANQNNIKTVLVSGGFEPVVKAVAKKLGFDRYVCNKLEIVEEKITGRVIEPIVDASTKLNILKEESHRLSIELRDAVAVGDGANDLPMLQAAGLGIAYQGKPLLRQTVPYQINFSGLDFILKILGNV